MYIIMYIFLYFYAYYICQSERQFDRTNVEFYSDIGDLCYENDSYNTRRGGEGVVKLQGLRATKNLIRAIFHERSLLVAATGNRRKIGLSVNSVTRQAKCQGYFELFFPFLSLFSFLFFFSLLFCAAAKRTIFSTIVAANSAQKRALFTDISTLGSFETLWNCSVKSLDIQSI